MFQEGFERRYIRWMKDAKKSAKVSADSIARSRVLSHQKQFIRLYA